MPAASMDWALVRSRFGNAGNVPALLADAARADDLEDANDLMWEAVAHVVDGRRLEPAAPAMVRELAVATEHARHVAPFLHGMLVLLEPEALADGDPRVVFSDGFLGFIGTWESGVDWADRAAQSELRAAVRAAVSAAGDVLRRAWTGGDDRAAVAAIVVASRLGGRLPSELLDRAAHFSKPASQVAAVAAALWPHRRAAEPRPEIARYGAQAQALAAVLAGSSPPAVDDPVLRSCLRPPQRSERRLALDDGYDVVWSAGLAGLFAAAIATTAGTAADELLRAVVLDAEAEDVIAHVDWAPPRSPAGHAAYWLLRRTLPDAWRAGEVLGPEDVSPAGAAVLRLLAGCSAWKLDGMIVFEFGIRNFERDAGRLVGDVRDVLTPPYAGYFGGTWVTWSRWKWLMNTVVQSRRRPAPEREAAAQATAEALLRASSDTEREALRVAIAAVLTEARKDLG